MIGCVLLVVGGGAFASSSDLDYSPEEMEAAQAIREVDLGIERLYQEDEVHYVYGIPDAERSPAAEDANGLVWV